MNDENLFDVKIIVLNCAIASIPGMLTRTGHARSRTMTRTSFFTMHKDLQGLYFGSHLVSTYLQSRNDSKRA